MLVWRNGGAMIGWSCEETQDTRFGRGPFIGRVPALAWRVQGGSHTASETGPQGTRIVRSGARGGTTRLPTARDLTTHGSIIVAAVVLVTSLVIAARELGG